MADKMSCPGCDAYTSTVLERYLDGDPCPYCDLSATATREILAAKRRSADAELTAKYTEVVKRCGKAEGEAARLRNAVEQIGTILENLAKEA